MKFDEKNPSRPFTVGLGTCVTLLDCGRVALDPNEQVTFTTPGGGEYDLVRKDWGFYATPSLNGRLARFGLRGALVLNRLGQLFLLLVEHGREPAFEGYVQEEGLRVLSWLDTDAAVKALVDQLDEKGDRA